ncbi:hybrid non-ribosomal peptide synthetase/type I polyketide synthase [Aquimarina muelleri]|uniref:Amino acid adenylation domain-containing protein n=1 Tax=Aquimarina muelleri TaxID=279356 RepID=A0A918JT50_9FLAO|nr:hybrid non-ribosomal peptide synthetase/type I polyketide synthase [Aquimarina muelleri]MCX2761148.1 hybrid non-ribosomal peptide synthetase/type I polyketide synthase [Aquimarina muelleri]GGX08649.1 hypothetical protein GCM10007384_08000 [Aquimarina muelleri]
MSYTNQIFKNTQEAKTLIQVFENHLTQSPNKVLYRFLLDGEAESDSRTYLELYNRSKRIASHILIHVNPGDRVLLLYPSGLDFVDAFFGCMLAGVIAVPAFPPQGKRRIGRLEKIVSDCDANLIMTTEDIYSKSNSWFDNNEVFAKVEWLKTNVLEEDIDKKFPLVNEEDVAFLQYTSGSTGDPKGVMVTHSNIIHNSKLIQNCNHHTSQTIGVSWLPIYHDMGLIGNILQSFYVGFEMIIMPPTAFVQKPVKWLKTISKYKATLSGGPNFAYDLCVNQIKKEDLIGIDLSSWLIAYNGSEPIRTETMGNFADSFEHLGFQRTSLTPCYGMAETTLIVSSCVFKKVPETLKLDKANFSSGKIALFNEKTPEADLIEFVGNGPVLEDLDVIIVNPDTKQACEANAIGEIWISGPSVTKGYWNKKDLSKEIFSAYIRDNKNIVDKNKGPYLRTGDMGFLNKGQLYISGRLKEMMIINGVNHFPQDIEQTVQRSHSDLQNNAGAIFSITVDGKEQLAMVQEIKRTSIRSYDFGAIIKSIYESVFQEHELAIHSIVLVSPGNVPKTSSGKIKRVATKIVFESDTISGVIDRWVTGEVIKEKKKSSVKNKQEPKTTDHSADLLKEWLQKTISEELKIDISRVSIYKSFAELGITSIQGIRLSGMLSEFMGEEISPVLIYSYPDINSLANYLKNIPEISDSNEIRPDVLSKNEPIAIISMACRFPGANTIEEFWENLKSGKDAITEVPITRWDIDKYYKDTTDGYNMNTRWGGFIDDVDMFDASFFEISPREAKFMDPQQRILLELSHELIERAGYIPSDLKGTKTGVYIGVEQVDYSTIIKDTAKDVYSGAGLALNMTSNRLSYFYDFRGPSISIDTACSASLTSIHMAVKDIRNGESTMAIAGGVNLLLSPDVTVALSQANMMSKDGRCKTFDDSANGYVRSEGCGLVLLKSLSKAIEDGDKIEGIIKGSAVNQDGRSNGLTAPNGLAQENVIKTALESANIEPNEIVYVEAHGTGTPLGDPIEINALNNVYRKQKSETNPLIVGSVKSNIGHLEAAAGIAGVIKSILCLKYRQIPKQLHYKTPNTNINWGTLNVVIPDKHLELKEKENSSIKAGVSSFGFGGTNAHIILEEAPIKKENFSEDRISRSLELIPLSGKNKEALNSQIENLSKYIEVNPELSLRDLAYSLSVTRSHFSNRIGILSKDIEDLKEKLNNKEEFLLEKPKNIATLSTAFLFTGQGSQYINMGKSLYQSEPVFKETLHQCASILKAYLEEDIVSILLADAENEKGALLNQTLYTQPILFSLEYALYKLWESWGIEPDVLLGHSVGELVAACIAGVFSLEEGLKLIAARGRLMQELPEVGTMASLQCGVTAVSEFIEIHKEKVSLAGINSPNQTIISGDKETVFAICEALAIKGIQYKELKVSHAFHSPLMKPMLAEFKKVAETINYKKPAKKLISNVSGKLAGDEIITADYWVTHISAPVDFLQGMQTLETRGVNVYVEIGPHPVLISLGKQCVLDDTKAIWGATMRRGKSEDSELLKCINTVYQAGKNINWQSFYKGRTAKKISCPTYAFQRKRHWIQENGIVQKELDVNQILKENQQMTTTSKISNDIEKRLKEIISGSLQMNADEISLHDPLLQLGADSLVLSEIVTKIKKEYKVELPIRRLFDDLTNLASIIKYIIEETVLEDEMISNPTVNSNLDQSSIVNSSGNTNNNINVSVNKEIGNDALQVLVGQFATQNQLLMQQFESQNKLLMQFGNITMQESTVGVTQVSSKGAETKTIISEQKNKSTDIQETIHIKGKKILPSFDEQYLFFGELPKNQELQLPDLIDNYTVKTQKSKSYAVDYRKVLADYRSSFRFKIATKEMIYPIVNDTASGSRFIDIDGNEYIDIVNGFGSCIFGHQPDDIIKAIEVQLHEGINIGPLPKLSGEVASLITEQTGMERVCFANTGTEAISFAMRFARNVTGKKKIVKFTGSYHGHSEIVLGANGEIENTIEPMTPGITKKMVEDLIVLDYNDEDLIQKIKNNASEIAGIIIEPVRSRYPGIQPKELLKELRRLTKELDIPLIFDEIITGFRIMPGGAQEYFGIKADMATYGKILGGGMPIGAVAGSSKYLDSVDGGIWYYGDESYPMENRTFVAGTFTRHPLAMAAAKAVLNKIKKIGHDGYLELNRKTKDLVDRLNNFFKQEALPVEMVCFGSLFSFKYKNDFELLLFHLLERGIYALPSNNYFLTFAHTDEDITRIYEAICESVYITHNSDRYVSSSITSLEDKNALQLEKGIVSSPVTLTQEKFNLLYQIDPQRSLAYMQSFGIQITGSMNVPVLEKAIQHIIQDHQILQSKISEDGKRLLFDPSMELVLKHIDISEEPKEKQEQKYKELVEENLNTTFSFSEGPLIRLFLVRFSDEDFTLFIVMHHIIADGWSCAIIIRELVHNYNTLMNGQPHVPSIKIQFSEYVKWYKRKQQTKAWKDHEEYLLNNFSGKTLYLNLPFETNVLKAGNTSGSQVIRIESGKVDLLKTWSREQGLTLFMTFLATFELVLFKLSKQKELVIGLPVGGRSMSDIDKTIGDFSHYIPLASSYDDKAVLSLYFVELKRRLFDAYEHQDYPFAHFVELLQRETSISNDNFINTIINFDVSIGELEMKDVSLNLQEYKPLYSDFDLILNVIEDNAELIISLDYRKSFISDAIALEFLDTYTTVLNQITSGSDPTLQQINLLSDKKITQQLVHFNETAVEYPKDKSILSLFKDQVHKTPDNIAVVYKEKTVTYTELDEQSNQLAHYLIKKGVTSKDLVAICMDRSLEMITGVLAILKAGGAYVSIDPDYPLDRIHHIIEDSKALFFVTTKSYKKLITNDKVTIIAIDTEASKIKKASKTVPDIVINLDQPVYVIYTSGSTGKPKGVVITHANLLNMAMCWKRKYQLDENLRLLQMASFSFDVFSGDLCRGLLSGGQLILCPSDTRLDPEALYKVIETSKVNFLEITPALAVPLMDYIYENSLDISWMKLLVLGSDVCSVFDFDTLNKRFGSSMRILNSYGTTESTIDSSYFELDNTEGFNDLIHVPIGKPLDNTSFYILDESQELVPIGVVGELYIGGEGLAKEYLNKPALTMSKFIAHPFNPKELVYKTGDLAHWLPDGNMVFVGRKDNQVKIRGYRIELGEIESVLSQEPIVKSCCVLAKEDSSGGKRLIAYVVTKDPLDKQALEEHLKSKLPEYMIPRLWVELNKMPLTPNGKIDKKGLPDPDFSKVFGKENSIPKNQTEEKLVEIWKEVLSFTEKQIVNAIPLDVSFFEIGGDSLRAGLIAAKIKKQFDVEIPIAMFFTNSSITSISNFIIHSKTSKSQEIQPVKPQDFYEVSAAQKRMFFVHMLEKESLAYNEFFALTIQGTLDVDRFQDALSKLIELQESLRTVFRLEKGIPVQVIKKEVVIPLKAEEIILSNDISVEEAEKVIQRKIHEFIHPFDLEKGPLLRVKLLQIQGNWEVVDRKLVKTTVSKSPICLFLIDMHHIITDGYSFNIFSKDILKLYNGEELPKLTIQYKDYAFWNNQLKESKTYQKQEKYWVSKFEQPVASLRLPYDFPTPENTTTKGLDYIFEIDEELTKEIKDFGNENKTTLFITLLSAYYILLQSQSLQEDIVIGFPVAGRPVSELHDIIGMYINMLALRNFPEEDKDFLKFLNEVRQSVIEALENQEYQFEDLVKNLGLHENSSNNPLFDAAFVLQSTNSESVVGDSFKAIQYQFPIGKSAFNLTLEAEEIGGKIECRFEYRTQCFKQETIKVFSENYINILKRLLKDPSKPISAIGTEKGKRLMAMSIDEESGSFNF